MTNNNRLAITAVGFNSAAGTGLDSFYSLINNGPSEEGIKNYDPQQYLGTKGLRFLNKATRMYCNLAFQTIEEKNLKEVISQTPERVGLYDGSDLSNIEDGFVFDFIAKTEGPDLASPMSAPNTIANASSSMMAIKASIKGPNYTVCGGACAGLQSLDIASLHIFEDFIDYGIVGSTEVTSKYHQAVRRGEKRPSGIKQATEMGIALMVESYEKAKDSKVYAKINAINSGHRLQGESNEGLLARLTKDVLKNTSIEPDFILLGAGIQNVSTDKLEKNLFTSGIKPERVYYPELIYGNGDNAGGLAGILFAIGLFEDKITNFLLKPELSASPEKSGINSFNSCLVLTIDKSGYGIITQISK